MIFSSPAPGPMNTVLNIGCGPRIPSPLSRLFPADRWRELRMDIDPGNQPDLVASVTDMSALADGSVGGIWSSHMLEHLYRHEVAVALGECWRVLSPGGVFVAMVPDFQTVCRFVAEDRLDEVLYVAPSGPVTAHDIIFGYGPAVAAGNSFMAHRTGFTPSVIIAEMEAAGFGPILVQRQEILQLQIIARRPHADGRPIADPFHQPFRALS